MKSSEGYVVALDVGEKRIGVAITHTEAGLPKPLTTLNFDQGFWSNLDDLLKKEQVVAIVVGLPRDMEGRSTPQTKFVADFISELESRVDLPIHQQDEAVTSVLAQEKLDKTQKSYNKGMVDSEAAAIILQDYMIQTRKHHA